jgi:acetyltransferase-like isoleucine patch superfamily enzyme
MDYEFMRGREYFKKYSLFIRSLERIARLLPGFVKQAVWTMTTSWTGKIGLVMRYVIVRTSARSCGDVVYIGPFVEIRAIENLVIGSNVSIHRGCYVDAAGGISIGNDVSIAHNSSILSSDHQWMDSNLPIRDNPVKFAHVMIENDVWIGCGVRILSGITIESRSVVAAGAVVTKNVSTGTLVGGVPARFIKSIGGLY